MIHSIVFDLDGVLFDGCTFHREMFLLALAEYKPELNLTREYHDTYLKALSTKKKLQLLNVGDSADMISRRKQELTMMHIHSYIFPDEKVNHICRSLISRGYTLYCVSNSVRSTVETCLRGMGVIEYFTGIISNEDVVEPKPSPEPYLTLYKRYGLDAAECLIIEDSDYGFESATLSGGKVLRVRNCNDVTLDAIVSNCAIYLT